MSQIHNEALLANGDVEFTSDLRKNNGRQIKAMMQKHYILKKRLKGQFVSEFIMPVLYGVIILWMATLWDCDKKYGNCDPDVQEEMKAFGYAFMPLMMCIYVPNLTAIASRFLIQTMVEDKQNKMRETLRIMSLSQLSYGFSFFAFQAIFALIGGVIFAAFVFNNSNLFPQDPMMSSIQFAIVIVLHNLAQIPFSMAISTLFNDSKVAAYVGQLIIMFPMILFISLIKISSYWVYAFYPLPIFPASTILVQLTTPSSNVVSKLMFDASYLSASASWAVLVLSIPLWFVIYLYLDSVLPSEFGIQKHPLFCLRPRRPIEDFNPQGDSAQQDKNIFNDADPIKLKNLTKKFGSFTAVDKLSFSIRQGEIFTILGHNGAGKTTAIYMLTGVHRPNGGDAFVYGSSIVNDLDTVQTNLGLCQQFDVLTDWLTVREHLVLTCELKNLPVEMLEQTITETLRVVMLTEHQHKKVKELSGGMKRKLSLAMAIVTKPKVIILDEPTSGLDVESRRQVWALIKQIKMGRSIIMSSQHLEEADELADRICIMTKGQLLALDTPGQIKKQFGVGYKLIVEPRTDVINLDQFLSMKNSEIDPVILTSENMARGISENQDSTIKKLIYQVPFVEDNRLIEILKALEANFSTRAYIDIEMNSLEDAYINIAKEEEKLLRQLKKHGIQRQSINDREALLTAHQTGMTNPGRKSSLNPDLENESVHEDDFSQEDLQKYMSQKANPSFCKQITAMQKRRLLTFIKSPKEVVLGVNPVFYCLINLILFSVIYDSVMQIFLPDDEEARKAFEKVMFVILFPLFILISLFVSSGVYVISPVTDREEKLRYLLNFACMRPASYYLGLWLGDSFIFLIPTAVLIGGSWALQLSGISERAGWIYLALFIFSYPFIQLNYLVGFLFSRAETAFKYQVLPMLLIWILPSLIAIPFGGNPTAAKVLAAIFPSSALGACFNETMRQFDPNNPDQPTSPKTNKEIFQDSLIYYGFMILQGIVLQIIVISIDNSMINRFKGQDGNLQTVERLQLQEMQDVVDHRRFADQTWEQSGDYLIQGKELFKVYPNGVAAVNKNTFTVKRGEVFGLLGPNGAGKSTMFNIMTMDLRRTDGDVKIMGQPLDELDIVGLGTQMGMCPQFNTLWGVLTVDQCIDFIAQVKGLTPADKDFQKDLIKRTLDLDPFSETKAMNLSGGNKRKLVCAMSLVACPKVEFLDEPTTGVDPVSRRSLFKMLKNLQGSSLVLTTHRMDEAESLCDNIAIMINGRFVCYGSPGQLKTRYGQGYSVTVKHLMDDVTLDQYMGQYMSYLVKESTADTNMMDLETQRRIRETSYKVNPQVQLAQLGGLAGVLNQLCQMKYQAKAIYDYTLSRSSLEHVFIQFAKHQIEQPTEA